MNWAFPRMFCFLIAGVYYPDKKSAITEKHYNKTLECFVWFIESAQIILLNKVLFSDSSPFK